MGIEHRVSLYADDLLLYIVDPVSCVSNIVRILCEFGNFSGYKLNFSKSECFPINNLALQIPDEDLPFRLSKSGFKHLGIYITHAFSDLYDENFKPLISSLKLDFQRWTTLPLSLIGRINCIKMNVLPRFLYLFQCLPVFLSKHFFHSIDKLINTFLWVGKNQRVRREFLERPKTQGGLALQGTGLQTCKKIYIGFNPQKLNGVNSR